MRPASATIASRVLNSSFGVTQNEFGSGLARSVAQHVGVVAELARENPQRFVLGDELHARHFRSCARIFR